jgi:zinc transport system ATP-binding protein
MSSLLIAAKNVGLTIGQNKILENVSLTVAEGEIVTVIGPNGAGKSTLIKVILGLIAPTSGEVECKPGLRIGYVPQKFSATTAVPISVKRLMTLTFKAGNDEIIAALSKTGAGHLLSSDVSALSGGELQRVLLARALLRKPQLLVLDEPAQSVDFNGEVKLYELISNLRRTQGLSVLMVSHDLHVVMAESDRVICLNQHICCEGQPSALKKNPEFIKLFGEGASRMIAAYAHHHDHDHEGHHHEH